MVAYPRLKTTATKLLIGKNLVGNGRGLIDMVQSRYLPHYRQMKPLYEDKVDRLVSRAADPNTHTP
jgi:hypothetical protein